METSHNGPDAVSELPAAMLQTATAAGDWRLILPVVIALMAGALLLVLRHSRGSQSGFAILAVVAIIVVEIDLFWKVLETGPLAMTMGNWLPPFGISFAADLMGAGFALAASVVTLVVLVFFQAEIVPREQRHGFYPLVLLLLAGVTGAFLTGDLFNLYVWFEVMLIASFGLMIIGGRKIQLDGAVKYGFLNFLATTFFLVGLGYLYGLLGTLNMADISLVAPEADKRAMTGIAALFLLAFGMKAAAFPVNAWLPASYHTPDAAVSALFAGLLTKVGVYALLRIMIALLPASRDVLDPVLTAIAVSTLLVAPLGALAQTNLRRALGFIVIGGIGAVFAGMALPTVVGVAGAIFYAFHSILTMSALYLVSGLVERVTQATDTRQMGGVYAASSPISIMFLILIFGAAGLPPFLGFWPKLLLAQGAIENADWLLLFAVLANSILTSIAGTRLWAHIFWRQGREGARSEHKNDRLRSLTPLEKWAAQGSAIALVGVIVLAGLFPNLVFTSAGISAQDLINTQRYVDAVGIEVTP
ncbi:MAG TPA: Na+/H+ antiporter subunit D [Devosia sp.]|nr:Na+/H+ antiporter subunit D [Devosia sp.]